MSFLPVLVMLKLAVAVLVGIVVFYMLVGQAAVAVEGNIKEALRI
jgi:hypothetical protein